VELYLHSPYIFMALLLSSLSKFLCLTEHHAMKTYWEGGCIIPRILDLGTRQCYLSTALYLSVLGSSISL